MFTNVLLRVSLERTTACQNVLSGRRNCNPRPSESSTLIAPMMEAVSTSETSVRIYQTARRNILEHVAEMKRYQFYWERFVKQISLTCTAFIWSMWYCEYLIKYKEK
jgi:hypothetical protein